LPDQQRQYLWNYLRRSAGESREAAAALINLAWSSAAALAMAPLHDLLNLGNDARMNLPGRAEGNWRWRCTEDTADAGGLPMAARFDENLEPGVSERAMSGFGAR
jgi:4-alpha-glucanotransferase